MDNYGIIELKITERDTSAFVGRGFGETGIYERIEGSIRGSLDPNHRLNAGIALLEEAPRDSDGRVPYEVEFCLIKPLAMERGNGWLFHEILNRGTKRSICRLNNAPGINAPRSAHDAGNGFLMRRGFSLLWSAWQGDIQPGDDRMIARLPVAAGVSGISREEIIEPSDVPVFRYRLTYPAADIHAGDATLTVRVLEKDPRSTPADLDWRFVDSQTIEISRPASLRNELGAIYEFIYRARDPIVMGIGFAATRDIVSFFRNSKHDATGNPNPLLESDHLVRSTMGFGLSQSGRFLRDFLYQGFNEALHGGKVFDAVVPVIAGARRTFINRPFAQPGRYSRQHEDHAYPDDQFPFTYVKLHDPLSGRTDGLLERCRATGTTPKLMHFDTESELWAARASLVVTDCEGRDIELPDDVRVYLAAGIEHGNPKPLPPGAGANPSNPLLYGSLLRPLIDAAVAWVDDGVKPPPSVFPSRREGSLLPLDEAARGFPSVACGFPKVLNELRLMDYSVMPPKAGAEAYPVFVARVDGDGNPVGGLRHILLRVPIATHAGWNLRARGHSEGELFGIVGSLMAFAMTEAERLIARDPRPSIEARYGPDGGWIGKIEATCADMIATGDMLPEDANDLLVAIRAGGDPYLAI